jgi:hypothetical protein
MSGVDDGFIKSKQGVFLFQQERRNLSGIGIQPNT